MITIIKNWFKAQQDRKELLLKLEKREKEIIWLVNVALDEMIGAEIGWNHENGRRWQLVKDDELQDRTLFAPVCLTPKASHRVTIALKQAGDFKSGPKYSELTASYSWGLRLSV